MHSNNLQFSREQNNNIQRVASSHMTQQMIKEEMNGANGGGGRTRQDNSLGELTRKFITLIQESENKSVDLNDAAKKLEV